MTVPEKKKKRLKEIDLFLDARFGHAEPTLLFRRHKNRVIKVYLRGTDRRLVNNHPREKKTRVRSGNFLCFLYRPFYTFYTPHYTL